MKIIMKLQPFFCYYFNFFPLDVDNNRLKKSIDKLGMILYVFIQRFELINTILCIYMNTPVDKTALLNTLSIWNRYLKRKVRIIACGGTALTLLNLKESTKDVDLLIPEPNEYRNLIKVITDLGYEATTGTGWQKNQGKDYRWIEASY